MSQKPNDFSGVYTAIVTPFTDTFAIDYDAFERLVQRQLTAGVRGITVCGTTGEAPTLAVQEKLSLIKRAKTLASGKALIMAGTAANNTAQDLELSKLACEAGADLLLITVPPYNKPNPSGLLLHFQTICAGVSVPVCIYHHPGRTGLHVPEELMAQLCSLPNVAMVKDSSASITYVSGVHQRTSALLMSGDDDMFLPTLAVGGQGLVSVISNLFPQAVVALHEKWKQGDAKAALHIHNTLFPLMKTLFVETNPTCVKKSLHFMGLCTDRVRLPLGPVSEKNVDAVKRQLEVTRGKLEKLGLA